MKHTLVALLQDHPGVLHRVASLIRRRGFNIDSLTVGRCEIPEVSRMTLVVDADVNQVTKQLNRLIEVLQVHDVTQDRPVIRETVLVKVDALAPNRGQLIDQAKSRGARVADVGTTNLMFELTDTPHAVDAFIELLRPAGIKEMSRTGQIAMARGLPWTLAPWTSQADGHGD
jgi:acetolactate synthase I/III small subunit